jgi:ATP-binding cassette subfamily B protein
MQGRTTFIIAHRIQSVMDADLILVFEQGRIVQRGSMPQLLAQARHPIDASYDVQTKIETLQDELTQNVVRSA